jgi:HPt (histidine-containing phosphotransfer) domain-containing protein
MVHALKGISRSIGAAALGDMAAVLEEAGRAKDMITITDRTGEFLAALKTLTSHISAALNEAAGNEAANSIALLSAAQLQELREALLEMTTEKINSLITEYSSLPLEKTARELIGGIEQDVLLFEYEDAVTKLGKVI